MMQKKIAERWAKLIVTAIKHALDTEKTYITIAGRFNTQYEILEWPSLLDQCLTIFEEAELYEHCADVVATQKKANERVATFEAHLHADAIRG